MSPNNIMDQISEQFGNLVKDFSGADIQKNLKSVLTSILHKMDLVTREEFETQKRVLSELQERVTELEKEILKPE